MLTIHNLTAKDVTLALKRHLSLSYLCQQYNCSEADIERHFRQRLFKFYDADKRLKELRANDKRAQRTVDQALKKMTGRYHTTVEALAEASIPTANPQDPIDPQDTSMPNRSAAALAALRDREAALSDSVIKLEAEHKRIARSHRDCIRQLRCLQQDLEQIKTELQSKVAAYDAIVAQNNDLIAQMNEISADRRQQLDELTAVRAEIDRQTVIPVFFYEDGAIEPDSSIEFQPDEAGADTLYEQLLNSDICQSLRLRDIRLLARAIAISRNSNRQIDPIFDNSELDTCFSQLTSSVDSTNPAKFCPPPE